MPLLLHFVTESGWNPGASAVGYRGAPLRAAKRGDLACWYSELATGALQDFAPADAVALHRLAATALAAGVIPFRFPTVIEGGGELDRYLCHKLVLFRAALDRVRGNAQMDVNITAAEPARDAALTPGRAYLAAARDKLAGARLAEREIAERTAGLVLRWATAGERRCALVPLAGVEQFQRAAATANLPPGVQVRITGPWPATAFLDELTQPEPGS